MQMRPSLTPVNDRYYIRTAVFLRVSRAGINLLPPSPRAHVHFQLTGLSELLSLVGMRGAQAEGAR